VGARTSPRAIITSQSGTLYRSFVVAASLTKIQSSVPRPMVKARFTSLAVPETGAKETKIRLALWGFTCHVYPNLEWISDLARFMKAPPGVSVPSSE
jgi:autophagy-related protein 2